MNAGVPRFLRLAPAIAAGLLWGHGCSSPEGFHRNSDAGLAPSGSGGRSSGSGGAGFGTGGSTFGSGGAFFATGGSSFATGGATATGGSTFATGGATTTGGSTFATGGATTTGGSTFGTGGAATGGAATGGAAGTGTAGSNGTAGASGMGGTGTGGMATTCPTGMLMVSYAPIEQNDGQAIVGEVHISTSVAVPINQISFKYWYTNETGSTAITTEIDYVGLSTGMGLTKPEMPGPPTATVTPPKTNATTVTTITIPDTVALNPGATLNVRFRIHQTNYQGVFMMANDYSFGATQTLAMPWMRITAYVGGVKAWGDEPL